MTKDKITDATATQLEQVIETWILKFKQLDAQVAFAKPEPERWSIAEVIGHLVDSACNNHQRFVRAQHCTELTFPKYEQNDWVAAGNYQHCDWNSLVQLWYHYNRQLAVVIRNIADSQLSTSCIIEPYDACTLGFLVTDYLDHLNYHLAILAKRI